MQKLARVLEEPPFRLLSYFFIKRFAKSVSTIDKWGTAERPNYLAGVLQAAKLAKVDGVPEISVIEFGVAGGSGLVQLQSIAEAVEQDTGVRIHVFGFDTGEGLPSLCGDYRDHPDQWKVADYRMDVPKLQARLTSRTRLILGQIADTVPRFVDEQPPPLGFIACDVDLYSSTKDVLRILTLPGRRHLRRVFIYFDDLDFTFNHRFAGEWLAIDEFNSENALAKIDVWHGIRKGRVFQEQTWLDKMFVAHDLEMINNYMNDRAPSGGCALD